MPEHSNRRRGVAALLAMLYLVLFSVLAVGFYASTNNATQIVHNEQNIAAAQMATESGVDFMRYRLAELMVPPNTAPSDLFNQVYAQLKANLENTGNLGSRTISRTGSVIYIPSNQTDFITLGSGARFRATVEDLGQKVRVKVVARHESDIVLRAVQLDFDMAQRASAIFDYGIASKGRIMTAGSARIRGATDPKKGSVLSTATTDPNPVDIAGEEVSGDISIVNPSGSVTFDSNASIGGTTNDQDIIDHHIHKGVSAPEFPTIDTSAFAPFATNTWDGVSSVLDNVIIPANSNPVFTGAATIKGVLYVETPNKIEFRGGATVQGVVVVQNNPIGTVLSNVLDFRGNVSVQGVETLPESYGDLRKLTGSFILAPGFHTKFSGDFGTVNGSIISAKNTFGGSASGTVMGTVINMSENLMAVSGNAELIIASTGTSNYPAGVFFSSRYVPLPGTYEEVKP